jgi:hypothetical protein
LACVYFRQEFGRGKIYRLQNEMATQDAGGRIRLGGNLAAPVLFGDDMTHERLAECLADGWRIKSTRLTATFDWPHFIEQYGSNTVLLFGVEEKGALRVSSVKRELEPRAGWLVIALVPPENLRPSS